MATALELIAQKKAELAVLEQAAAAEIAANKKEVVKEILAHMAENKVEVADLQLALRIAGSKYSNAAGDTWSGRGKQPAWIVAALAGGAKLEDLATIKTAPAA